MTEQEIQRALDKILPKLASNDVAINNEGIELVKILNEPRIYEMLLEGISISDSGQVIYELTDERSGEKERLEITKKSSEVNLSDNDEEDDLPF